MWVRKYQPKRLYYFLTPLVLSAALICTAVALQQPKPSSQTIPKPTSYTAPLSYRLMQLAQVQVRLLKPPPTLAALEYAYIAKAYNDAYASASQTQALYAGHQMMRMVFPSQQTAVDDGVAQLTKDYAVNKELPTPKTQQVVTTLQQRFAKDGHNLQWNGVIPTGLGKWVPRPGITPMTPRAGEWQRWNVSKTIQVPPPPAFGSPQDLAEINTTYQASSNRTGEDVNMINFWGGVPGTETPSGIWQNQLYKTIEPDLRNHAAHADRIYASLQSSLATTLSDAFMECWKVKYTYWTARPDMRDARIHTAMPDPVFPSYVSGHSTISKAAADVLSVTVPKYEGLWQKMAVDARQSRLKAGIHFNIDNSVGFQLGAEVANQTVSSLKLARVL